MTMTCGEAYAKRSIWKEILIMLENVPNGLTAHELDSLLCNKADLELHCADTTWSNNGVHETKLYHVIRNNLTLLQTYGRIIAVKGDGDYVYQKAKR